MPTEPPRAPAPRRAPPLLVAVLAVLGVLQSVGCGVWWVERREGQPSPPRTRFQAPDFELRDAHGTIVALSTLRSGSSAVVVVFYRGFW
ncbi:MAG: hypothetical protein V3V08_11190 [Nannocystaceae bacterium]